MATRKRNLVNKKWRPMYCRKIIEFFDKPAFEPILIDVEDKETGETKKVALTDAKGKPVFKPIAPPTLESFARHIKVNPSTLREWKSSKPAFAEAYEMAKAIQKDIINENSLLGHYDRVYAIFFAKNVTDMRDRNEQVNVEMGPDDWVKQMSDEDSD